MTVDTDMRILPAEDAGANGVVAKPFTPDETVQLSEAV